MPEAGSPVPLVVAGGGAAGFMAAITAAEAGVPQVQLWEATAEPLSKVRINRIKGKAVEISPRLNVFRQSTQTVIPSELHFKHICSVVVVQIQAATNALEVVNEKFRFDFRLFQPMFQLIQR